MTLPQPQIETSVALATWLGVEEIILVREDLLPEGGGKKRRALESKREVFNHFKHIHILSYAGSHTAYTLARLLPEVQVHLYGSRYGGGAYERTMIRTLNQQSNIAQKTGPSYRMTLAFNLQKFKADVTHHFMRIGGSLETDPVTDLAVDQVVAEIGKGFHHFVAVASGNLLKAINSRGIEATGVLTQPPLIRFLKSIQLKNIIGLKQTNLGKRIEIIKEIRDLTGSLWDPIFMGTVFTHLKSRRDLPPKVCIWVTCPTGINWLD